MNTQYIKRPCPICKSTNIVQNQIKSNIQAETKTIDELRPYWNGFFKEKIFFTYHRCSSCGLLYNKEFFTNGQLGDLYSNMPDNTAGVSTDILQKTQDSYYDLIKKYINDDGGYLELGPDIGLFTKNIITKHNFHKIYLLEPNKEVWDNLKNINQKANISISEDINSFDHIEDNSLSLVVMIHGPDHFMKPVDTLLKIKTKMKKEGKIVFVNHDESSLIAKISGANWPAYCMQHPQLFNQDSIKKLFEISGFSVENVYKTKNYFPIGYLVKHGLWAIGLQMNIDLNWQYNVGLKLGNIMTIASLK